MPTIGLTIASPVLTPVTVQLTGDRCDLEAQQLVAVGVGEHELLAVELPGRDLAERVEIGALESSTGGGHAISVPAGSLISNESPSSVYDARYVLQPAVPKTLPLENAALGTTPSGIVRSGRRRELPGLVLDVGRITAAPRSRREAENDERPDDERKVSTEKEGFEPSTQEFTHVTP